MKRLLEKLLDFFEVLYFRLWYETEPKFRKADCLGCIGYLKNDKVVWLQNCLWHKTEQKGGFDGR